MRKSSSQLQLSRRGARLGRERGVTLIDALIAIVILSFGLIGMTRMQGRMVTAATDAQLRTTAIQMADELLNTVIVDNVNAACYTLPQSGACGSSAATARTTDWATRVAATMPGTVTKTVTLNAGNGQMMVSIGWTARDAADARLLNVVTDVR
ncbi:MAG: pilus assembly protein PilV [Rubrivivax sp.]|jgi:type IV pilus assembly protein PilV|nr:pilus assembly protein PilV [Rubrivivax sp.]MBK7263341.1 pilus assembly protein PilV [Rubrivivax sp.]MBK8528846.1 pilus assembly protein PilV [Rubrivivax sp.]